MSNRKWTDEQLIDAVKKSKTKINILRILGLSIRPGNYETINLAIKRLNISIEHMTGKAHGTSIPKSTISLDDYMSGKAIVKARSGFKRRIIREKILKNECNICGIKAIWRDNPLVLILDHINGNNQDYSIENLRLLCPNCNAQQPTFCRKKKGCVAQMEERLVEA